MKKYFANDFFAVPPSTCYILYVCTEIQLVHRQKQTVSRPYLPYVRPVVEVIPLARFRSPRNPRNPAEKCKCTLPNSDKYSPLLAGKLSESGSLVIFDYRGET